MSDTKPSSHDVYSQLREMILNFELYPGSRVTEQELASLFGVSRTPVRDALTLLQTTGLVEIRSKRGSYVFQPDEAGVQAICDFRAMLELHGATLSRAADREATLAALREAQAQMEAAAAADDDVAYGRGDSAFHEAFFSYSGNPYVVNSYALVSGKIAALRTNMARQFSNARDVSLQEHRAMVACVDAGDFAQLAAILQAHVGRTVEAFRLASAAALDAAAAAPTLRLRSTD